MRTLLGELFIVSQGMRAHGECAHARIIRQRHGHGRALPPLSTLLIDEVTHGRQMRAVFTKGCSYGVFQSSGAVSIEQLDESAGEYAQMGAASGGELEQGGR